MKIHCINLQKLKIMRIFNRIISIINCYALFLLITSCERVVDDFGNNSAISGRLVDQSGNIVPGDIASSNLTVKALGEGDVVTTDIRVKGDGTFQNTKLFATKYKIWITGPVIPVSDTIRVDFAIEKSVVKDIVVIPFITIKNPTVIGNPTSTTVDVNYEIVANSGKTVSKRELYCSTVPYPNSSTGSGPYYSTKNVTLTTDSGNVSITGLVSKTKYYIRIGVQATGASGFNYSEQIEITTL